MGYEVKNIQNLVVIQIKAISLVVGEKKYQEYIRYKKADIQIRVEILINDILHVEKLSSILKNLTGEMSPSDFLSENNSRMYNSIQKSQDKFSRLL